MNSPEHRQWTFKSVTAVACSLALLGFGNAAAADTWRNLAPMPQGVQEIYADVLDGLIYIGGGYTGEEPGFTDQFIAYDAANDSWRVLARLPEARHHLTISTVGGKIYGMGGFRGTDPRAWVLQSTMFVYDPATDSWTRGIDMPRPRGEHVAPAVDGKIYAIGGRIPDASGRDGFAHYVDTSLVEMFDPESGSWTRLADAPTARNSHAAAVIDGKIYVVGGRQNQTGGGFSAINLPTLEVYDPMTDTWEKKADMPEAQGGLAAAVLDGKLYSFGGEQWRPVQKLFATVWVYDPATDSWDSAVELPEGRHGLAAATIGAEIFAIGGADKPGAGPVNSSTALKPGA